MSFDTNSGGANGAVSIDTALLSVPPIVFNCWFNPVAGGDNQDLMDLLDKDSNNDHQYRLFIHSADTLRARSLDSGGADATTSATIATGVWQMATGVWEADDDRRCYLDGGNKGTNGTSKTVTLIDRFSAGIQLDSSPGSGYDGLIADMSIRNVSPTDAQVAQEFAGTDPRRVNPRSLLHFWPFYNFDDLTDLIGGVTLTRGSSVITGDHHGKIWRPVAPMLISLAAAAAPAPGLAYAYWW